jgi:hypothetical protein
MALLLQVLGVLAGGLVISAFFRGGSRGPNLDPRAVAVVVAVAASLLFWANVLGAGKAFNNERKSLAALSSFDASVEPGADNGQNVAFLEWARKRMHPGDTFAIEPADLWQRVDQFIPYQWSVYQLSPHRSVAESDADWLVFYGTQPEAAPYDKSRFGPPLKYSAGFAIARSRDAG